VPVLCHGSGWRPMHDTGRRAVPPLGRAVGRLEIYPWHHRVRCVCGGSQLSRSTLPFSTVQSGDRRAIHRSRPDPADSFPLVPSPASEGVESVWIRGRLYIPTIYRPRL
jgi:hypothetical protein